jgi:hypothetical protein
MVLMLTAGAAAQEYQIVRGPGLARLGQHSEDEIRNRQRQLRDELEKLDLSSADRKHLRAEQRQLELEADGNEIVGAYLKRLESVGQRNSLHLSDISVIADPVNDLTGFGFSQDQINNIRRSDTNGFVSNFPGLIYIPTWSFLYQNSVGNTWLQDYGGAVLRHEQVHIQGGGEREAYTVQRAVLQLFRVDFPASQFMEVDRELRRSISDHQHE